ncbi:chorismate-binding protein [Bacteriovoracaceae bacterium]|nr:chorismate-binding protein [Bacteriovoracaceae bacterium]
MLQKHVSISDFNWNHFDDIGAVFGEKDTFYFGYGPHLKSTDPNNYSFYFNNFFNIDYEEYTPSNLLVLKRDQIEKFLNLRPYPHFTLVKTNEYEDLYLKDVNLIKSWINSRNLKKLVAINRSEYQLPHSFSPVHFIKNAINGPKGILYGIWRNSEGILGLSPEYLFRQSTDGWKTMALAGTIDTSITDFEQVLLNDPKEIEEHQVVVDHIEQSLKSFTSNISISNPFVTQYGKIAHIQSDIIFDYPITENLLPLLEKLSPTPALGGAPKIAALERQKETHHYSFDGIKRRFGGILGINFPNHHCAVVAIRNIQWRSEKLIIESGTGIVEKSVPEKELLEMRKKRECIENLLD